MRKPICLALLLAGLVNAGLANAGERAVARLVGVSGNVLVSNEQTIASAGESLRLRAGMRVLATLNSTATVEYDDGCRVQVNAGERFEVRDVPPCAARTMPVGLRLAPVLKGRS